MKKILFFCLSLVALFAFQDATHLAADPSAKEIVQKMEARLRGAKSSQSELKLTITRPSYVQEISLKTWTKGQDYGLVLITAPARDKGTAFLKNKQNLWNWQPKINRAIKLPPSMLAQNWMGSDFSMDDMVRQGSFSEDYTHKLIGSETVEGLDCYSIELKPKTNAAVVWGKIKMYISKKDFIQLKSAFFDEDMELVHTVYGKKSKKFGWQTTAFFDRSNPSRREKKQNNN